MSRTELVSTQQAGMPNIFCPPSLLSLHTSCPLAPCCSWPMAMARVFPCSWGWAPSGGQEEALWQFLGRVREEVTFGAGNKAADTHGVLPGFENTFIYMSHLIP